MENSEKVTDKYLKDILSEQYKLHNLLAIVYDNMKERKQITIDTVESHLRIVDSYWNRIERHHTQLMLHHSEALKQHDYLKKDFIVTIKNTYLLEREKFMEIERTLKSNTQEHEKKATVTDTPAGIDQHNTDTRTEIHATDTQNYTLPTLHSTLSQDMSRIDLGKTTDATSDEKQKVILTEQDVFSGSIAHVHEEKENV